MKANVPTQVGIGFTVVVAAATFLVAVVAALFLIWQPDAAMLSQQRTASQISLAAPPAFQPSTDTAQLGASRGGSDSAPQAVQ